MVESWAECSEDVLGDSDEIWSRRVVARQRQINIGKNRPEYKRYVQQVAIDDRTIDQPQTPDFRARISKRQFDRELGVWRRQLHEFDALGCNLETHHQRPSGESDAFGPNHILTRPSRSRRGSARRVRTDEGIGDADCETIHDPVNIHDPVLEDHGQPTVLPVKTSPEVVKLKLAEQLDVPPAHDWWPLPLEPGDLSGWDFNLSPDKQPCVWSGVEDPNFQTPPHTRHTQGDWTPANPPLVPSNLSALWNAEFDQGFDGSTDRKNPYEWMPEMNPSSEFAMMLQCCHEWTHSSQTHESQAHGSTWPMEPAVLPVEFAKPEGETRINTVGVPVAFGSGEAVENGLVSAVPDSPRTPKPMRGFASRSPNSKLLSASSQQSLPATPQPRGWVPETPSPGPRTSVHWGPLLHGPAPLPPLVLAQSWES